MNYPKISTLIWSWKYMRIILIMKIAMSWIIHHPFSWWNACWSLHLFVSQRTLNWSGPRTLFRHITWWCLDITKQSLVNGVYKPKFGGKPQLPFKLLTLAILQLLKINSPVYTTKISFADPVGEDFVKRTVKSVHWTHWDDLNCLLQFSHSYSINI